MILDTDKLYVDNLQDNQSSLVTIYSYMTDLAIDKEFNRCDEILSYIDVQKMSLDLLLAFIFSTRKFENNLKVRKCFYKKAEKKFIDELGYLEAKMLLDEYK